MTGENEHCDPPESSTFFAWPHPVQQMCVGLAMVADGLVRLVTLDWCQPDWGLRLARWWPHPDEEGWSSTTSSTGPEA